MNLDQYMLREGADLQMSYSSDWRTSDYHWVLTEPLWAQLLTDGHSVLVAAEDLTSSAIISTYMFRLLTDPGELLTVNNQIINWRIHYPALRAFIEEIRSAGYTDSLSLYPSIINTMLAPGQTENNVVNPLSCGHELDTETELPVGSTHYCSQHGPVTVVSS
jgi:hypothetical protein